jgi:hypothetical protein
MVVEGTVVMVENIIRHIGHNPEKKSVADRIRAAAHEVQRPVFYSITIIITAYLPIFTLQRVEGRLVPPHGLDGGLCPAGRGDLLNDGRARPNQFSFPQRELATGRIPCWFG